MTPVRLEPDFPVSIIDKHSTGRYMYLNTFKAGSHINVGYVGIKT